MKTHKIEFTAYAAGHVDVYKVTVVAYFHREVDAQEFIKRYSGYGRVYKENVCHEYKVFDSILDYSEYDKNTLVTSAKAKLTKDELDALIKSIQSTN